MKIIIGLGAGGSTKVIIDILNDDTNKNKYKLVGLLDDDPQKIGTTFKDIPIIGRIDDIKKISIEFDEAIICIGAVRDTNIRNRVYNYLLKQNIKISTIISAKSIISNSVVIASVLGVVYGAPLSEWLRPDFTLWIRGGTGLLKTSFAALCVSHFGAFDWKSTPAGWESTVNALERQTFIAKDLPLLIDDSRPATDQREAAEKRRKEGRLVRAVGNRSGRERLCADTSFRARYYP